MSKSNQKTKSFLFSFKFWLTTSILGLIVLGVTTNAVYDLIKTLHVKLAISSRDAFRFRYFIVDGDSNPSENQMFLQAVFESKQKVYVWQNDVIKMLDYLHKHSSLIPTSHGKQKVIAAKQYLTVDDFLSSLSTDDQYEQRQVGQFNDEPINEYTVHANCRRYLTRGLLGDDEVAKKFAQVNPDRNDFFYSEFFDRNRQCGDNREKYPQFEENSYYPPIKLVILDIENISDSPQKEIKIDQITYAARNLWKLYEKFSHKEQLPSKIVVSPFPIGTLTPGEHLLIPICILFERPNKATDKKNFIRNNLNWQNSPFEVSYYELKYQDTYRTFYFFGPLSIPKAIYYSGNKKEVIRDLNFETFTYTISGIPIGSCPFLYTYDSTRKEWINEGKILVNATGKLNERTDIMALSNFDGLIMIREVENETSYLDWAEVEIETKNGQKLRLTPKQSAFNHPDRNSIVLRKGESLILDFGPVQDIKSAKFILKGYYTLN